jgi:hypothetical protein
MIACLISASVFGAFAVWLCPKVVARVNARIARIMAARVLIREPSFTTMMVAEIHPTSFQF